MSKVKVSCVVCNKEQEVAISRSKTYKTCSRKCMGVFAKSKYPPNCTCTNCQIQFRRKDSQLKRYGKLGTFCTVKCASEYKRRCFLGENNPNFRGAQYDSSGYRVHHYPKVGRVKEHRFVALKSINREIPKGFVVHHKDCNIYNNIPSNLAVLSESDHRWIHKQFGNATLWALQNKELSVEKACEWSNDKRKANYLLNLDVEYQHQNAIIEYSEYKKLLDTVHKMIMNQIPFPAVQFVEVEELSETERGAGGYGSTGK